MKRYNRKRATQWQVRKRYEAGHPPASTSVPLAGFVPLIQKHSLLRLQIGLAALIRNRQRIEMRMSKAIAANNLDKAKVLAKLHVRSTTDAQAIADEIARRTTVAELSKPEAEKPKRKRNPRKTENHSRVRHIKPEATPEAEKPEAMPKPKPEATRDIETARTDEREAFRAELARREKA